MAEWKNKPIVGVIGAVVGVAAIILMVLVLQPKQEKTVLMSKSGQIIEMALPPGTVFPVKDPQSGVGLYPATKVKCQKCGWEGYIIAFLEPGKPSDTKCQKCGADKKELLPAK